MANDFYTDSNVPSQGASLSSSVMRAEFALIEAGFDKMPALTGNGSKLVAVNSGGTALEAISSVAVAQGGTGSTTASGARTALGLAIGTDVQAYDAGLADIAGLAVTDGNIIVGNGTNWVAESGATARTSLGVGAGDSPQFTGIELGHASDTTLTRVSAGEVAVEGVTVATASNTLTLTNKTLTSPTINSGALSGTFSGTPTFSGLVTLDGGGGSALEIKPGSSDHCYIEFFARTASPTTRSGYVGYGSSASNAIFIRNEISGGDIELLTTSGNIKINGTAVTATAAELNLLDGSGTGTFTGTLTGMSATTQGTITYALAGNMVSVWVTSSITGTSNSTAMTLTGMPAAIRPTESRKVIILGVTDNATSYWGQADVQSTGTIVFGLGVVNGTKIETGGSFTGSGTKGLAAGVTISYAIA